MNTRTYVTYGQRLVKSADGTEISADAIGNRAPECPVIVLIHGFSMLKEVFNPMFEDSKWTQNNFLVRYDARGHGRSGKPLNDEAWESRRMCEDFEAVCKEFGVQKTFVLGWSLGAAHFADIITYNTTIDVAGLINVDGFPYLGDAVIARTASAEALEVLGTLARPASVDVFQETALFFIHLCSNVVSPDLSRRMLEGIILQPRSVTAKLITRKQQIDKYLQDGREGKLNVLVVTGGKDKLIRVEGFRAVYEELGWKNCMLKHVEEGDHMPWVSSGEQFRDAVLGWVHRIKH